MAKALVEMAAEIVGFQASHTKMSPDEMSEAIAKVFDALRQAKVTEEEGASGEVAAVPGKLVRKRSIFRNRVICLECGREFKQLTDRHLAQHGLNKRTYKEKHGIPRAQKLVATAVSERRRQLAEERGLGEKLAEARRTRAAAKKGKRV
ncbi:MAG: MucR family transcriptional regulator [Pseudomonadota bacterium]